MKQLLDSIVAVVSTLPLDKIEAIAGKLHGAPNTDLVTSLRSIPATPFAQNIVDHLIETIEVNPVSADQLSAMLLASAHAYQKMREDQSIELVWTGPKTPFISPRRTEQALLEVINASKETLFIVSFVAYEISSIMTALVEAKKRNVKISMLMELSREHGGSIDVDTLKKIKAKLPDIKFYAWKEKAEEFDGARVHAKVAVADRNKCFITSANLTGYAMERNMEVGILISGGDTPKLLEDHLVALIDTNIISLM